MSLYSKVKMIGKNAGIPSLCPKMFRHTYIVNMYNKEMDLKLVQHLAGHVDIQTTASYINPDKRPGKKTHRKNADNEPARSATTQKTDKKKTVKCDSCEKLSLESESTRIDSGQTICNKCIKYFR